MKVITKLYHAIDEQSSKYGTYTSLMRRQLGQGKWFYDIFGITYNTIFQRKEDKQQILEDMFKV